MPARRFGTVRRSATEFHRLDLLWTAFVANFIPVIRSFSKGPFDNRIEDANTKTAPLAAGRQDRVLYNQLEEE